MPADTEGVSQVEITFRQKLSVLRKRLLAFGDDVKSCRDQGRAALKSVTAIDSFLGMCSSLEKDYQKFETVYFEMEELSILNNSDVFPSQADITFFTDVKRYKNEAAGYCVTVERKRKQEDEVSRLSVAETSTTQTVVHVGRPTSLPDAKLPTFSGNILDWPFFKDSFIASVHAREQIPKIDKFTYLISVLKPPALDCIKAIPRSDANYDLAWARILQKYDDQRNLSSAYIHKFLNAKPIQRATAENLENLTSNVLVAVDSFRALEIKDREDYLLFEIVFRYLDTNLRQDFEREHSDKMHPSYLHLRSFIEGRLQQLIRSSLDTPYQPTHTDRTHAAPPKPKRYQYTQSNKVTTLHATNTASASSRPSLQRFQCFVCKEAHLINECPKFRAASPHKRLEMLATWTGCRNCLCPKHKTRQCTSRFTCKHCQARHHSMLHLPGSTSEGPSSIEPTPSSSSDVKTPAITLASLDSSDSRVLLGTALARIKDCTGKFQGIRLVLDSGSQNSYITASCAKRLGLKPQRTECHVSGLSNTSVPTPEGVVYCALQPRNSDHQFITNAFVVPIITTLLPREHLSSMEIQAYLHLDLADPEFGTPAEVDFLLGADLFLHVMRSSHHNKPPLLDTVFGKVIMGPLTKPTDTSVCLLSTNNLDDIVQRFWETEEIYRPVPLSNEDRTCEEFFLKTTYREQSGRYVVALPFRSVKPDLGASRTQALSRIYTLENKLSKNDKLRHQYCEFMAEYLELGHMQLATSPFRYLIPHHAILKRGSESIRVVFDASAKTSNGSLNDKLLTGPQLQNDIVDIIVRFRRHPIVFTTDLVKMFRQVLVRPSDRAYQQILWRFSPDAPVDTYELNTITYGLKPSPFLAMRVIHQLVADEGEHYPEASAALINDMYVDDIVTGSYDISSTISLKNQLKELLSKGCFHLSKWASNFPEVIAEEDMPCQSQFSIDGSTDAELQIKILGLQWSPITDSFSFTVRMPIMSAVQTKRTILSTVARLYDPLGFLAPVIFHAKLILQDLWKLRCGWDDQVPEHILSKWLTLVQDLPLLSKIIINRYLGDTRHEYCNILGFCDASERGYCAAVYLSTRERTSLVKAKTKLAPIKPMTVPRLELCGAVLLTRLIDSIQPLLTTLKEYEIHLFTDSMVVLVWLSSPPHTLKTFVAHRVVNILETTRTSWWRHVSSRDNPADCGSRGLGPAEFINHMLWWAGPEWISLPHNHWPVTTPQLEDIKGGEYSQEIKTISTAFLSTKNSYELITWTHRFSNYNRLVRSFAYALRFIKVCKHQYSSNTCSELTASEIDAALMKIVELIQKHHYPGAYEQSVILPNQLLRLGVYLDELGILRVGGRLDNSQLPYDQKHPILLPSDEHFTVLLVRYYHCTSLHIGCAALQAIIQRKFWIISLRKLCRKVKRLCLKCRKLSKPVSHPLMGNLPSIRFSENNAFHFSAVDFAGPFLARETCRKKSPIIKVYLCLFICLSTKAVHLELSHGLSTEAFIDVFDRFVARRGRPSRILSDCGTNFVGTANYYRELSDWLDSKKTREDITCHSTQLGVNWDFNPPRTPHFGGIFEAAIKSAKTLLYKLFGNHAFTVTELSNAFTKVEAMLNSRPLYPASNDPEDCQPLTPGHFLIGGPLNALPEPNLQEVPTNRLSRWQLIRERTQSFWQRWKDQYLSNLMVRNKWYKPSPNFKIGDVVLLKDVSSAPCLWPYARITEIHPGSDGVVRIVTLQTKAGTFKRHVNRLLSLQPLLEESQGTAL